MKYLTILLLLFCVIFPMISQELDPTSDFALQTDNISITAPYLADKVEYLKRNVIVSGIKKKETYSQFQALKVLFETELKNHFLFNLLQYQLLEQEAIDQHRILKYDFFDQTGQQDLIPDLKVVCNLEKHKQTYFIRLEVFDYILNKITLSEYIVARDQIVEHIHLVVQRMIKKMIAYYSSYHKYLNRELLNLSKNGTQQQKKMAQHFINQKNSCLNYPVHQNRLKTKVPILFNQAALVLNALQSVEFSAHVNGERFNSKNGVIALCFEKIAGQEIEVMIEHSSEERQKYTFLFETQTQVVEKTLFFHNVTQIKKSFCYFDLNFNATTAALFGFSIKFGIGLTPKKDLSDNLFFHFQYHVNPKGDLTYMRFRFGLGYQHAFFIKNFLALITGLEIGTEFYLFKAINEESRLVQFKRYSWGFPTIVVAFPFLIELPAYSKVSFLFGIEPVLRLIQMTVYYDQIVWNGELNNNFYNDHIFRYIIRNQSNSPNLGLDLLISDMPLSFGMRIKI